MSESTVAFVDGEESDVPQTNEEIVGDSYSDNTMRGVITATTPDIACKTTHQLSTPSKFVFLSDQKSVPTDLKKLQERTIKRRRDLVARMHDLVSDHIIPRSIHEDSNTNSGFPVS